MPIYLNGKFTAQRTTGVQRVATQTILALDAIVDPGRFHLLCPPHGRDLPLRNIAVRRLGPARLPLTAWEQFVLPWGARDGLLLNLSGAAPALARWQMVLVHDAAVFDRPEAYTRPFRLWYRWLFRRLARKSIRLLTVSDFSRDRLARALGIPASDLAVLVNGADHLHRIAPDDAVLDRYGLRDTPFVLAVGSANPNKNLPSLIGALDRCRERGMKLVIVGGTDRSVFASPHEAASAEGTIHTGPLGDAALIALYRHARALVFPSLYEGFGLPPLEAMSQGCPVAAAHAAAIPEVCGAAALYFDPHRPDDIASVVERVTHDATLQQQLRVAGRSHAAQFRWEDTARQLLEVLRCHGFAA